MDLQKERSFQIENKIYCLGSPVVCAETLQQLLYALEVSGETNRPIVIINPAATTIPDFDKRLENFLTNTLEASTREVKTSYILQDATDADIRALAEQQAEVNRNLSVAYFVRMYTTIRRQSKLKQTIDMLKSEAEFLWRQHLANPNSNEGSDRYAQISYQELPAKEEELKQVTKELSDIPKESPTIQEPEINSPTEESVEQVEVLDVSKEKPASIKSDNLEIKSSNNCSRVCLRWLGSSRLLMPLAAAKNLADSQGYQVFRNQQSMQVEGYTPVPLEYLLMLGIPMYTDGVPVVYTKSGEFMRVGKSDVTILNQNYWYPKPTFEK